VRNALGARNTRLVRLFLVESTLMTALATLLGLAIAFGVVRAIVSLAPADIPRLASASVDLRVLGVTIAVSTAGGDWLRPFPVAATGARRRSLGLARHGRATVSGRRKHLQRLLVAGELALAVVLLSGAALLIKSLWKVQQIDPGFESAWVLKAEYQLPASRYPSDFRRWPDFAEQHAFTARSSSGRRCCPASRRRRSPAITRWIPDSRTRSPSWAARPRRVRGPRSRCAGSRHRISGR
jgi:putative ABC transport system permease protein